VQLNRERCGRWFVLGECDASHHGYRSVENSKGSKEGKRKRGEKKKYQKEIKHKNIKQ